MGGFSLLGHNNRIFDVRLMAQSILCMARAQPLFSNRLKPAAKVRGVPSPFVVKAQRAIRKAQQTAARENARFGLPMIV